MEIERNPPGAEALYLESLNLCFPGWGDARAYAWAFGRRVGGPPADLMMLREGGELLAGSAVSYRTLLTPEGKRALIGIMTGSWTLPAARGRGAFTTIIEESVALTKRHGGALLLAFVTETNASFRRLEAAGSALFPTRYVSGRAGLSAPGARPAVERETKSWFERFEKARPEGAHFAYGSAEEWAGQHVERPGQPVLVEVENAGAALVETHGDFDRVQAICADGDEARLQVIASCLQRAASRGKRLFLFESKPARAERMTQELGLDAAKGYLTALPADEAASAAFLGRTPLAQALPEWSLDSGDRM
ncbi:MAG: hypothetical protein Q8K32_05705 [Archangium sp.]|nr:hypothetical protein [Archangium sp.]